MADITSIPDDQLNSMMQQSSAPKSDISSLSDEDLAKLVPPPQTSPTAPAQEGLMSHMGNDISSRLQNEQDYQNQYEQGKIGALPAEIGKVGQAAQLALVDPVTGLAKAAGEDMWNRATPERKQQLTDLGNTASGAIASGVNYLKTGAEDLGTAEHHYFGDNILPDDAINKAQAYYNNSPNLKATTEGAANIATALPMVKPAITILDGAFNGAKDILTSKAITPEVAQKSTDVIKDMSQKVFQRAKDNNQSFGPDFFNDLVARAKAVGPQGPLETATVGDNAVTKIVDNWQKSAKDGTILDHNDLMATDSRINSMIARHFSGGLTDVDGNDLLNLKSVLRDAVNSSGNAAAPYAQDAKALWAEKSKMDLLERIEQKASIADNSAAVRKRAYGSLRLNGNAMNMFSPEEQALIEQSAKTGTATNLLREAGSRLTATIVGAGAGSGFGPVGSLMGAVAAHVVASAARDGADYFGSQSSKKLANGIMGRAQAIYDQSMARKTPIQSKALVPSGAIVNHMTDEQIARAQRIMNMKGGSGGGNPPYNGGPIAPVPIKLLPSPNNMGSLPPSGLSDDQLAHQQAILRANTRPLGAATDISPMVDQFGKPIYKKSGGPVKGKTGVMGRFKKK